MDCPSVGTEKKENVSATSEKQAAITRQSVAPHPERILLTLNVLNEAKEEFHRAFLTAEIICLIFELLVSVKRVCVRAYGKVEKKHLAFILEAICLQVEKPRASRKRSMDSKRPLKDHRSSGKKSILLLSFPSTSLYHWMKNRGCSAWTPYLNNG